MAEIQQIQHKYQDALEEMEAQHVRIEEIRDEQGKLYILAEAPSEEAKNRVWDWIKAVDPTYSDLICDIRLAGAQSTAASTSFEDVAKSASPSALAQGLASAFRSDHTPPLGQIVSELFGRSNPDQKAGLLNQLFQVTPSSLAAEVLGAVGTRRQITAQDAQQVTPEKAGELAERAQHHDSSITERVGEYYAQHPQLVKTLGVGVLTFAVSRILGAARGRGGQ